MINTFFGSDDGLEIKKEFKETKNKNDIHHYHNNNNEIKEYQTKIKKEIKKESEDIHSKNKKKEIKREYVPRKKRIKGISKRVNREKILFVKNFDLEEQTQKSVNSFLQKIKNLVLLEKQKFIAQSDELKRFEKSIFPDENTKRGDDMEEELFGKEEVDINKIMEYQKELDKRQIHLAHFLDIVEIHLNKSMSIAEKSYMYLQETKKNIMEFTQDILKVVNEEFVEFKSENEQEKRKAQEFSDIKQDIFSSSFKDNVDSSFNENPPLFRNNSKFNEFVGNENNKIKKIKYKKLKEPNEESKKIIVARSKRRRFISKK